MQQVETCLDPNLNKPAIVNYYRYSKNKLAIVKSI